MREKGPIPIFQTPVINVAFIGIDFKEKRNVKNRRCLKTEETKIKALQA